MVITPEQLAKPGDEHSHQVALFQAVAIGGSKLYPDMIELFAIPNGAKLKGVGTEEGRREGNRMKAEGLRPGVADTCLPVARMCPGPDYRYHGLYLELKKPGREPTARAPEGGRSDDQIKWQKRMIAQGYAVATAYGWQAATHVLALYLRGELQMPEGGDCLFALECESPAW